MSPLSEKPGPRRARRLLVVTGAMLTCMTLFEVVKQALHPNITIWESHLVTILFSTLVAVGAAHLGIRRYDDLLAMLMVRNGESERLRGDLAATVERLQATLAEIKTLSGLLPICAWCRNVRDDKGYWSNLETYLAAHADIDFSHGLCPSCTRERFPEYAVER